MRNPMIYKKYGEMICDFNFDLKIRERIQDFCPLKKDKLFVHTVLLDWVPKLQGNLPAITDALKAKIAEAGASGNKELEKNLETVEMLSKAFLYDGATDDFVKLIHIPAEDQENATFPLVFCHNDAQENNILMHREDNERLMVIDYEYGGWNPMAMDLANYLNETMLDNSYPCENGITVYLSNCMTDQELRDMSLVYMQRYFSTHMTAAVKAKYTDFDDFVAKEMDKLI